MEPSEPTTQKLGIFSGISHADYLKSAGVSSSALRQMERSPAHAREWMDNPPARSAAFRFGTACHTACLEHTDEFKKVVVRPKFRKAGKGITMEIKNRIVRDEIAWDREHENISVVDVDELEHIKLIRKSVLAHPEAKKLVQGGQPELSCYWKDEDTGLLCKCRPDQIFEGGSSGIVVDFKTADDASFNTFQRRSFQYQYHVQASYYYWGVKQYINVSACALIVVEKSPPYGVAVFAFNDASLEKGEELYRKYLNEYAECTKTNKWPCYPHEIQDLDLPYYGYS